MYPREDCGPGAHLMINSFTIAVKLIGGKPENHLTAPIVKYSIVCPYDKIMCHCCKPSSRWLCNDSGKYSRFI